MKKCINIEPYELEDDDTIGGYNAKDLVIFAKIVKKAGIKDEDLKSFINDVERINDIVRAEYDEVMRNAVNNLYLKSPVLE